MKIAVLVSGGVDSSVALRLLVEQGYEVTAFYLKIWLEDELSYLANCPWEEDLNILRSVCGGIGVPLHVISMQQDYYDRVVQSTLEQVRQGLTPNPDIWCNNRIKFGMFLDKISGFDKIASGHYAQLTVVQGGWCLQQAPDPIKDQTYFLSHLPPEKLQHLLFPIGHLSKSQVREHAQRFGLINATRKDSQGICFLGKFKYRDFLEHYLGEKRGDFRDTETGKKVGTHPGFWYFTEGQRRGIGLSGGPWYVVSKDPGENIVWISTKPQNRTLESFQIKSPSFFIEPPSPHLKVKLRHGPASQACTLELGPTTQRGVVYLQNKEAGIAPGQYAAFYSGNLCLGSAVIC